MVSFCLCNRNVANFSKPHWARSRQAVLSGQTRSGRHDLPHARARPASGSRAIGLGGYHIGQPKDEQEGIRIIRTAIDRGINFMDNCWDYHDGKSEVRMGKALRDGYRQKVFLMTKFDGRTEGADGQADRRVAAAAADRPRST